MATKRRRRDYEMVPITSEERTQLLSKSPLDFSVLKKGHYLPVELIEEITTTHRKAGNFWAKLLGVREAIQNNTEFITTTRKGGIIILTDPNALHNEQMLSRNRLGGVLRNSANIYNRVDAEQLSLEDKTRLERTKNKIDRLLFAVEKARTGLRIGKIRRALGLSEE